MADGLVRPEPDPLPIAEVAKMLLNAVAREVNPAEPIQREHVENSPHNVEREGANIYHGATECRNQMNHKTELLILANTALIKAYSEVGPNGLMIELTRQLGEEMVDVGMKLDDAVQEASNARTQRDANAGQTTELDNLRRELNDLRRNTDRLREQVNRMTTQRTEDRNAFINVNNQLNQARADLSRTRNMLIEERRAKDDFKIAYNRRGARMQGMGMLTPMASRPQDVRTPVDPAPPLQLG